MSSVTPTCPEVQFAADLRRASQPNVDKIDVTRPQTSGESASDLR
jgi:hypothetical protein